MVPSFVPLALVMVPAEVPELFLQGLTLGTEDSNPVTSVFPLSCCLTSSFSSPVLCSLPCQPVPALSLSLSWWCLCGERDPAQPAAVRHSFP